MLTDEFVAAVRDLTQLPDQSEDWTPEAILAEGSRVLGERFEQPVVTLRSGYWLMQKDYTMSAGMPWYRIHPRAASHGLELFTVGNTGGTSRRQLSILTQAEALDVQYLPGTGGSPNWFSLDGDGVMLYPTPMQAWPLQQKFYLRPPTLIVPPELQYIVTGANNASQLLVTPSTSSETLDLAMFDIVNLDGSGGAIAIDVAVASSTFLDPQIRVNLSTALTDLEFRKLRFDGTVSLMPVEQWWSIPLPRELHIAVAAFTAAVILVDTGDAEKAAQMVSRAEAAIKLLVDVMTPRVKTRPWAFKTRNTFLRRRAGLGYNR